MRKAVTTLNGESRIFIVLVIVASNNFQSFFETWLPEIQQSDWSVAHADHTVENHVLKTTDNSLRVFKLFFRVPKHSCVCKTQ